MTGCPGTSAPTASTSTTPLTRGLPSRAISAAIQPPIEFPITVTSQTSRLVEQTDVQPGQVLHAG